MKREPRGFQYALDPLRKKCDWELQDLRQALGCCNREIAVQNQIMAQCKQRIAAASEDLVAQQGPAQIIHVDKHFVAHDYIAHQLAQLAIARKTLAKLESECEEIKQNLHRLQKFTDGLEEHREDEVKEYAKTLGKISIVEADDAWLRSMKWRAAQ